MDFRALKYWLPNSKLVSPFTIVVLPPHIIYGFYMKAHFQKVQIFIIKWEICSRQASDILALALHNTSQLALTYWEKAPHHSRRRKASKHIIRAGEVREVRKNYRLATALAPHVHLATLGLGSRSMWRVAGCNLYNPVHRKSKENVQFVYHIYLYFKITEV